MTGGQALVRQLIAEGIKDVFGVPGVQLDWAVDAFRLEQERIRLYVPRHEQTTSYMADGYARSTGKIGTCMVVPGPGLLNAMAGLSTAYACNSRVLCISGNIHSSGIGRGAGLLHEIRDQSTILSAVTKWRGSAQSVASIPGLVREAVQQLRTGTPQPVGIEVSHDLLSAEDEVSIINAPGAEDGRLRPDPSAIEAAAALLDKARRPVIYVGGGVLAARATEALTRLAEKLSAPVVMGENGRGALSDKHRLALNALAGRAVFEHADVVLVVGSRFVGIMTGKPAWPSSKTQQIFLNSDELVLNELHKPAAKIHADAALGLDALADAVKKRSNAGDDLDRVREWARSQSDVIEPQRSWTAAIRSALPDDGIFVNELTQVGYFARLGYPVYQAGTFITPGYQGTLGFGFPTSLGAAVGNPSRPVISITGDGGFGWGMQELATARKYDLRVAVVVFNDGHFSNVRRMQFDQFSNDFAVKLQNPDFELLARAFGVHYTRADTPGALESRLKTWVGGSGPLLVEARVGEMPSPWHLIHLMPPPFATGSSGPPNPLGAVQPTA
jgi:acetolactate synthase-1/2/3 large subunit